VSAGILRLAIAASFALAVSFSAWADFTGKVVAVADGGQVRVLADASGHRLVPSVVSFGEDGGEFRQRAQGLQIGFTRRAGGFEGVYARQVHGLLRSRRHHSSPAP